MRLSFHQIRANRKRKKLLKFSHKILDNHWPGILEKCNFNPKCFEKPKIKLTSEESNFNEGDFISINIGTAEDAYTGLSKDLNGLWCPYTSVLKDDIVHETVHYLQNLFYDVNEKLYDPHSEGVAICLASELLATDEEYRNLVIAHTAGLLYLEGATLEEIANDHMAFTKEEEDRINALVTNGMVMGHYKERNSPYKEHAEGFVKVSKLRRTYEYDALLSDPGKFSHLFSRT